MRDPRWCDGWSNVNGVRRFGRPKLVVVATTPKCQRSRTGHRHPPLVPSPTAVLYVSCNCRACCSSGHSRRGQWGQTRETQDGRSPCTADGPAPSSNPHQHRLIASFGGTVHQQKLKAWLKRAKKGNFFKRPPQALEQWGWHPERIPKPGSKKKKALDVKQKLEEFCDVSAWPFSCGLSPTNSSQGLCSLPAKSSQTMLNMYCLKIGKTKCCFKKC